MDKNEEENKGVDEKEDEAMLMMNKWWVKKEQIHEEEPIWDEDEDEDVDTRTRKKKKKVSSNLCLKSSNINWHVALVDWQAGKCSLSFIL